jgi:hypothetical protein
MSLSHYAYFFLQMELTAVASERGEKILYITIEKHHNWISVYHAFAHSLIRT